MDSRMGAAPILISMPHAPLGWHEPSMIPKALKFATLQKKMAPIPTSPYLSFYGRLYGGNMCNVKT